MMLKQKPYPKESTPPGDSSQEISFVEDYPDIADWLIKNSLSGPVSYGLSIAKLKMRVWDEVRDDNGAWASGLFWTRSVNHMRLSLKIGITAIEALQNRSSRIETPLSEAKAVMYTSDKTKRQIIADALELGRIKKCVIPEKKSMRGLYPTGPQLMEWLAFQFQYFYWGEDEKIVESRRKSEIQSGICEFIMQEGISKLYKNDKKA